MSEQLQTFTEMLKEDKNRAKALFFQNHLKKNIWDNTRNIKMYIISC